MAPLQVFPDPDALAEAAAELFATAVEAAVAERGRAFVALSGGSTPKRLYRRLAAKPCRKRLSWTRVQLFWGDERPVPPDHPDSNFGAARRDLLAPLGVPEANVHRIRGEEEPARAAEDYEAELRRAFGLAPGELPRFDLVLLGMGADGHTASLFPGNEPPEAGRLVAASFVATRGSRRITLTLPVLCAARRVLFLVAGADKARALRDALENPSSRLPAARVRPADGDVLWYVDRDAARDLESPPP